METENTHAGSRQRPGHQRLFAERDSSSWTTCYSCPAWQMFNPLRGSPGNSQQRTSIHLHGNTRRPGLLTTLPAGSYVLKHLQLSVEKLQTTHSPPDPSPVGVAAPEVDPTQLPSLPRDPLKHPDANATLNHQNSPGQEPRLARIRRSRPLAGAKQESCTNEADGTRI